MLTELFTTRRECLSYAPHVFGIVFGMVFDVVF